MRKAERLFQLTNLIRSRQPITAEVLAEEIGVSVRSIYRYIDDLSVSGIPIYGTQGLGYQLDENFDLPPLNLTEKELDALLLGVGMVTNWTGDKLSHAAKTLADKIEAAIPRKLQKEFSSVIFSPNIKSGSEEKQLLRNLWEGLHDAIKEEKVIQIGYCSLEEKVTKRTIYPLGLFYWGSKWTLGAWCVKRQAFRSFRIDRIIEFLIKIEERPISEQISLKNYIHTTRNNSKY